MKTQPTICMLQRCSKCVWDVTIDGFPTAVQLIENSTKAFGSVTRQQNDWSLFASKNAGQ